MLLIFVLSFYQAVPIQLNGVVPKDGTWHSGTNQFIVSKVAGKKLSAKVINTDKYTAVLDVTVPGETKTLNQVSTGSHGAFTFSVQSVLLAHGSVRKYLCCLRKWYRNFLLLMISICL